MNLPPLVRALLLPLSWIYGWWVKRRAALYASGRRNAKRLKGAVISVGNLTVGGTGKTPMVLWLAEKLVADGKRVAILSRGYRGEAGTSDEIAMMKQRLGDKVVFGVGTDRFAEGQRVETKAPIDVFLLDDGFQHLRLARDVDVLLLDGSRRLRDEPLLPAGTLREPISAGERADLVVVTRDSGSGYAAREFRCRERPFFAQTRLLGFRRCEERGEPSYLSEIMDRPLFAFCGIGNPEAFFTDLQRWHVPVAGKLSFADHHRYSQRDLSRLASEAGRAGARGFVTTEKDEQNLPKEVDALTLPVYVAVIDLALSAESEFSAALERLLAAKRGVSP